MIRTGSCTAIRDRSGSERNATRRAAEREGMPRPKPSTRIGEAERAAAQRALHDHMNAGRLQVSEYAERSAVAANAVMASEIAALFTDLPAPHPKLPGSPLGGSRRNLTIVGVVAAVVLVGLLAFAIGRGGQDGPVPSPAAAATPAPSAPSAIEPPAPSPESGPPSLADSPSVATPDESTEDSGTALPDGGTVRRTTGAESITLRLNYGVDLDDNTSPNWNVGMGCCDRDVGFASDASRLYIDNDYAVVTGPAQYSTCSHETGYTNEALERGSLHPGETLCVRTNGNRYAFVTIISVSDQAFQFRATVWDPQISS
jgi:Domain of unknown function (DUF1707)